jgi:hypothetical protein
MHETSPLAPAKLARSVGQGAIWLTFVVSTVYISGLALEFLGSHGGAP